MEVFISWSGNKSHAVAKALRDWFPKVINAIRPYLSSEMDKGSRWRQEIAGKLNTANAGIICLTRSNRNAAWLLFEAGALSKSVAAPYVCTLLIDLNASDIEDPLAQFQATRADKTDIFSLLKTLNQILGENALPDSHITEVFELVWPRLEAELRAQPNEETGSSPVRSEREVLEEILQLMRNQARTQLMNPADNIPDAVAALQKQFAEIRGYRVFLSANNERTFQLTSVTGGAIITIPLPDIPKKGILNFLTGLVTVRLARENLANSTDQLNTQTE